MNNAERKPTEKRAHKRRDVELPVLVHNAGNRVAAAIHFDLRDLSLGGAFVQSFVLFEVGEELVLEFQIPAGPLVEARGHVVRVVPVMRGAGEATAGMGIAFSHLSGRDRQAVRAFLSRD